MKLKYIAFVFCVLIFCVSCSVDNDEIIPRDLQEYIAANSDSELNDVIAYAANADANLALTYIFYYPVDGATEIKYFETENATVDENNFANYTRKILAETAIFGGKLKRFSRSGAGESWCIVTYLTGGKLNRSAPIRLKNATNPTNWKNEVAIEYTTPLEPKFTWSDFGITDNDIYFQVLTDEENDFISGIYTRNNFFQYYDISDTDQDLVINTKNPPSLILDATYNFTLMALSKDNWVNLMIQKSFVVK
ncbi:MULTISPECIES: hypothetical protein [unclassified Polaribacter]|uniref:hypothetical protein n=1 Tax=unclassified Polaribacter TaxID=196858 RepID=UPI0011BD8627|nr:MULTISPECIES: hypothetical protein [unclassified Polaribacter]TXD54037.1 hypothetical protein ES043_01930 [Polaribacter sp. IC063]TXD62553.1 hypothetical protein ES044_00960 [Polaribacter sp. IC066]